MKCVFVFLVMFVAIFALASCASVDPGQTAGSIRLAFIRPESLSTAFPPNSQVDVDIGERVYCSASVDEEHNTVWLCGRKEENEPNAVFYLTEPGMHPLTLISIPVNGSARQDTAEWMLHVRSR